jgi:PAS domain S-box-containing protein
MDQTPAVPGFDEGAVFRSLFKAYPDALLMVDLQGVIVLANPAAVDLLGYAQNDLVGLRVDDLVPDAIRPRHASYRDAYAHNPRTRPMGTQMDLVAKRRDGSEVLVEIALSPLHGQGLPYVVAAIRDVAAYPRVKQALQRARYAEHLAQFGRLAVDARDLQSVLEQVPTIALKALQVETSAILLLEPSGLDFRIVAGIGLLQEDAVGDCLPLEPESPGGQAALLGKPVLVSDYALEGRFNVPLRYRELGLVCELVVPLFDRGRTIGIVAVLSRTPQRFGDEEIRFLESLSSLIGTVLQRAKSDEALNHSQRLESVGHLTGGIAHDFNNLLTVIAGNLQVLGDLPPHANDASSRQLIGAATHAAQRGAELTGKLLAFSRRQVLQPTMIDTRALLISLTDMLRRTLDQRISITLDAGAVICQADPVQLEAALLNVAINARDAMPSGGTIAFACHAEHSLPAEPSVEPNSDRGDPAPWGYAAISITDSGRGMPDSVKERAFEPFFTTKETGRGTGLGLSTVYGFVKQSRGAVHLRSAIGAGTTVTLYLPLVQHDAGEIEAACDTDLVDAVPDGLHVLLVEDDLDVSNVVETFLKSLGCRVECSINAESALVLLASGTCFGLVITDIALGVGMQGTELAQVIRLRQPSLPVLLVSGFSSGILDAPPGWELLRKPFTRGELERAVTRTLAVAH